MADYKDIKRLGIEQRHIELDLASTSLDTIKLFMDETADIGIYRDVLEANRTRPDAMRLVYEHPDTPDDVRADATAALQAPVKTSTEIEAIKNHEVARNEKQTEEMKAKSIQQRMQALTVTEKVRLAMKGNRSSRSLLLKDSNKEVKLAVLENPYISETEIELIANNRQSLDDALRKITKKREWMKNYNIRHAIIKNPKTPAGVSIGFMSSLKKKDLMILERNRNVSEPVRVTAKKLRVAKSQ